MSREIDKRRKALGDLPKAEPTYDVGYGKPPVEHRFRKGRSGNPRGRRKGSKNRLPYLNEERLKDIIIAEAYRRIEIREGERTVSYSMAQAVVRSLAVNAVKGQSRAQKLFTELLTTTEDANKRLYDDYRETLMNYKFEWERELEERKRTGRTGPEPIPHPDHITLDMKTGLIHVKGPFTKEEKARLDDMRARKKEFEEEIVELRELLKTETDPRIRELIEDDIRHDEKLVAMMRKVFKD